MLEDWPFGLQLDLGSQLGLGGTDGESIALILVGKLQPHLRLWVWRRLSRYVLNPELIHYYP